MSKTRTRSDIVLMEPIVQTVVDTSKRKNASDLVVTTNIPINIIGQNGKIMTDVVTKGFKTLSAQGKVINNPMTKIEDSCQISTWDGTLQTTTVTLYGQTPANGSVTQRDWVATNRLHLPSIDMFNLYKGHISGIAQQASNEAIAASHQRNVLGIVDIMEAGKTGELLTTNLRRFETLMRGYPLTKLGRKRYRKNGSAVQRYKARTPEGTAADLLGLHLEYQYGVLPLMMTIEGLMKTFSDSVVAPPVRQTFRGSQSDSDEEIITTTTPVTSGLTGNLTNPYIHTLQRERFSYARAGVLTEYKPSIQAMLGLEMRDIPSATYELIKFSFVLDWFYDLNSYIEAVVPVPGFTSLATWVKQGTKEILSYQTQRSGGTQAKTTTQSTSPLKTTTITDQYFDELNGISWTRDVVTRTPGISAGLPKLDLKFRSTTHAISALALAVSSARKSSIARL